MRAIQMQEFGGPEVLRLTELPEPAPGDDEVAIRVARAGLNYADTHQRTNSYLAPAELPMVPGTEVAGVRADSGERVVALCGTGGYAEVATAPRALTFPIPEGVDDGTALALLLQGTTAWHIIRTSARLAEGESILIHAAAGGVGSLAVQLAGLMGAGRVIAAASSEDKRALALELGADEAIDAAPAGMKERIEQANGGRKVDIVLEMAGGEVFEASLAALAPFGRLVTYGIASGEGNTVSTGALMRRSRAVIGFWLMHCLQRPGMIDEALADLFERVARGELRAVVGATYPLEQAAQAQIDIAERHDRQGPARPGDLAVLTGKRLMPLPGKPDLSHQSSAGPVAQRRSLVSGRDERCGVDDQRHPPNPASSSSAGIWEIGRRSGSLESLSCRG